MPCQITVRTATFLTAPPLADLRAEEQGKEGQRSWPNGQLSEMQELGKVVKPKAEEEHKEAAVQEEEDVEVEYNEVGI